MYDWRGNFGWSSSKSNNWRECKKRFHYATIKKHEGDRDALDAKRLSDFTSLHFLKGKAIHKAIGTQIGHAQSGRKMDLGVALREIERDLAPYRPPNNERTTEIVNGFPYDDKAFVKILDESKICLEHFFYDAWPMLCTAKCIEHDPGDGKFGSIAEMKIDGVKVYVKPDLVTESNGIYTLTDWKTGKDRGDDYTQQMAIYSLYVMDKYGVDIENVRAELYFLQEPSMRNMHSLKEDVENTRAGIKKETQEMLDAKYPEGFPAMPGPQCKSCNYLTICAEGKQNLDNWRRATFEEMEE